MENNGNNFGSWIQTTAGEVLFIPTVQNFPFGY